MMLWIFDILMLVCLFWLAWRAMTAPRLEVGVVTFLPYGLLMAVTWARLRAPDIAIAEAAIGAGLTTALLFAATRRLSQSSGVESTKTEKPTPVDTDRNSARFQVGRQTLAATVALVLFSLLGFAVYSLPLQFDGLAPAVAERVDESGVGNPVTAVLLNFRGYDTLLEIAVLLLAVIGVTQLRRSAKRTPAAANRIEQNLPPESTPMLHSLVHVFLPLIIMASGYLLWIGGDAPGGAFQAGALLAGAGVLLILDGIARPAWLSDRLLRVMMAAGLCVFGLVAVLVMLGGGALLEYPLGLAKPLILLIEAFAAVSIACILTVLFHGVSAKPGITNTGGVR